MASPQLENGYTPIANEILHALMGCKLLVYEMKVVLCVVRKTYGWRKKNDWVSNSQISEVTGMAKSNVTRTVKSLVEKKILYKDGKKIGFQKNWELWKVDWSVDKKVISRDNSVISPDNKKLSHQIPTKEKKETIQNKYSGDESPDNQKKDMSFKNQRKYREDSHWEEPAVDADSGEEIEDELEVEKRELNELNEKIRHNLKLIAGVRGLPFGVGKDMAYHVKIYREMLNAGWTHEGIFDEFMELINSPHWKEQRTMGKYPGMNTVQFTCRNKQPV